MGEDDRWPLLVQEASKVCAAALAPHTGSDWKNANARDLNWSVWDTVVHVNDDLYFYAAQILLADRSDYVCFELAPDDHATPDRLLAAMNMNAQLLAAAATVTHPQSLGQHVYGASDPAGFAAMGVVELLVHTFDAIRGLEPLSQWRPPESLARAVLARLFPHRPRMTPDAGQGHMLLYVTGRSPLGELARLTEWRWYGSPI
ncbi:hypothetical protein [Leekyejoonella antrihumi]|uniref:Mycothiol-dependent maleylpyruvate isomerase metal-binding domain-containing protein n=1 Tax=Leekyejoonella antrihumi TaxID=1660198 RepID=A0A563DYM7_9MICO|nr:hypothetical protein [Leekyejoonella antrihumi]TWP35326.1 hypothetical protein FGL98_14550 [Leekyejoonella antrihumi]